MRIICRARMHYATTIQVELQVCVTNRLAGPRPSACVDFTFEARPDDSSYSKKALQKPLEKPLDKTLEKRPSSPPTVS
jgi:hypothetical protein